MSDELLIDPKTGEVLSGVLPGIGAQLPTPRAAPVILAGELPSPDRSESLNELAAALAKAQGKIQAASKDQTNPHFQSKYATLASCWEACREALSANGLALIQRVKASTREVVVVETLLVHASGQWIRQDVRLPVDKPTAQGVGSAITYGRRYGLSAMVGVAPDDDDDGNAASGKPVSNAQPARAGVYRTTTGKPDPRLSPEDNVKAAELFAPGRK